MQDTANSVFTDTIKCPEGSVPSDPAGNGRPNHDASDPVFHDRQFDAVITNGWGRIGYNIVRSLGRKGLTVALGTDEFLSMALLSRYTAASFRHPSFFRDTSGFIARLKSAFRRFAPRVYLPSEQEVFVVAKFMDEFSDLGVKIPLAPFSTLRMLHKKDALAQMAASVEVPVPETLVPANLTEARLFAREIGDPVVVKRLSSSSGRGVHYFTQQELASAEDSCTLCGLPYGEFLVQRYVRGVGYGVSMLFHQGELRAKFTHKRLRERVASGGISTWRVSLRNPLLEEYAERILRHAGFHGVAMVEFKYDESNKKGWLLEVNPRFWGSLALAIHSGVDFPYLLYKMALDGDVEPVLDYQTNLQGRWIMGDAFTVLGRFGRNGQAGLAPVQKPAACVYDDLDWRDPAPFAGQFAFSAWKFFRTLRSNPAEADIVLDHL